MKNESLSNIPLWSPTQPPAQKSLWLGERGLRPGGQRGIKGDF